MSKITNIVHKPEKERYWIYVDGEYCTSIRERTFPALKMNVGDQLSCNEIKERESFHFKNQYQDSWGKEKVRLNKVKELIDSFDSRLEARVTGFGADTTEFIKAHPDESGKPDIEVINKDNGVVLIFVEVSGTERMRRGDYWVRPDKLTYAQNHVSDDVWIILHYREPQEKFIFIKPCLDTDYGYNEVKIGETVEHYVFFNDGMDECKTIEEFRQHLLSKL
jgi:hypothetical protein